MILKIKDDISYVQLASSFGDEFYLCDLKVYLPDRSYLIVADAKIRSYKAAGESKYGGDRRLGYRCYSHGSGDETFWVSEQFDNCLRSSNLRAACRNVIPQILNSIIRKNRWYWRKIKIIPW